MVDFSGWLLDFMVDFPGWLLHLQRNEATRPCNFYRELDAAKKQ